MDFSKNDFSQAKVGDQVWHFAYGWGVIEQINHVSPFPLAVRFDDRVIMGFDFEGKYHATDKQSSLFWNEIHFDIPAPPKRKVKKSIERWAAYDSKDGELTIVNSEEQANHAAERWNNDTQQCRWQVVKTLTTYEIEE